MDPIFSDRSDAGRRLAASLGEYAARGDVVVLGLPRGGVVVAYEVARSLGAPLDVFVVRKLGVPGHEELAMGAVASGGVRVLNRSVLESLRIADEDLEAVTNQELAELRRREAAFRQWRDTPQLGGRTVILVDDGLATGSTMMAAVQAVRRLDPRRLVVAVPVGARETCGLFEDRADEVVCLHTPEPLHGVGLWYEDFAQTTDEEVRDLLARAALEREVAERSPGG